ncbi:MAG: hypothetical protein IJO93_06310 [Clostridia bacterium]|nr:hypothetical protein [Clostridia bacterium]
MDRKLIEKLWGLTLVILGICTVALGVSSLSEVRFIRPVSVGLGVLILITIPFMIFFTVRIVQLNRNAHSDEIKSNPSVTEEGSENDEEKSECQDDDDNTP